MVCFSKFGHILKYLSKSVGMITNLVEHMLGLVLGPIIILIRSGFHKVYVTTMPLMSKSTAACLPFIFKKVYGQIQVD